MTIFFFFFPWLSKISQKWVGTLLLKNIPLALTTRCWNSIINHSYSVQGRNQWLFLLVRGSGQCCNLMLKEPIEEHKKNSKEYLFIKKKSGFPWLLVFHRQVIKKNILVFPGRGLITPLRGTAPGPWPNRKHETNPSIIKLPNASVLSHTKIKQDHRGQNPCFPATTILQLHTSRTQGQKLRNSAGHQTTLSQDDPKLLAVLLNKQKKKSNRYEISSQTIHNIKEGSLSFFHYRHYAQFDRLLPGLSSPRRVGNGKRDISESSEFCGIFF